MAVGADDAVPRTDQPLFGQEGVLDSHPAHVIKMGHALFMGEFPGLFDLLGGLDVFVRGKVIHHQGHPVPVEHLAGAAPLEFVDRDGRGDVVAEAEVQLRLDKLPRRDLLEARVGG